MIREIEPIAGIEASEDFKNLVALLAVYSEAENRLDTLQATVNAETLETVDEHKGEYTRLQEAMTKAESALELLARKHPGWFAVRKSIKTPYGEVSLKNNPPKLIVENEELSLVLLEAEATRDEKFDPKRFIRERKELDLESLAKLDDEQLKKFRIKREQSDTFGVKAAKTDMGKAVKAAATKEKK